MNTQADTGEVITDLEGNVLPKDPNGFDPEGLVALPDGTFWASDEYGPFIAHFDATGRQLARLSPFDGTLPRELAARVINRGMEGLTVTPDGSTLVGIMQSALQQSDLAGFDAKRLTPLRIVTYRLSDGLTREYYLLDDQIHETAMEESHALVHVPGLADELPAYEDLLITSAQSTSDPARSPGRLRDAAGGLIVGGRASNMLHGGSVTGARRCRSPRWRQRHHVVSKTSRWTSSPHDIVRRVASSNTQVRRVAIFGGAALVIAAPATGIIGLTNATPPFSCAPRSARRCGTTAVPGARPEPSEPRRQSRGDHHDGRYHRATALDGMPPSSSGTAASRVVAPAAQVSRQV